MAAIDHPRLFLAMLWHHHQPMYQNTAHSTPRGSYTQPWVRLHALRDYYPMAALLSQHPAVHLTINLTPMLLAQIEDYVAHGATDRALELTRTPAEELSSEEREEVLSTFFDADWHHQISPHPRYGELFEKRQERQQFSDQDVRDLQMWFNLAWFATEFHDGAVELPTGVSASVRRYAEQDHDFSPDDVTAMLAEQLAIMAAVIPIHRALQEQGQIEVATSPFAHPILPLLIDTDRATIDGPGASHPRRFAHPEDAAAQVRLAVEHYQHWFGRPPRGMWPAEGAVSQSVIPLFDAHGIAWIATDQGVLARSGRWGYPVDDPDVLGQPYRADEGDAAVSVFFRDTKLSDAIGFGYQGCGDFDEAARDFLDQIKRRFRKGLAANRERIVTVVLDGENAWGGYCADGRSFLHALYTRLEHDLEIQTVTLAEYLQGNPNRGVSAHPPEQLTKVYDLFTGSWIDEQGSALGVDLGTWIGEPEENRAWELLGAARDALVNAGATPQTHPAAWEALYLAEGSDWFWWYGADQDSGRDAVFDEIFRIHLKNVYRGLGIDPPPDLDQAIVQIRSEEGR